MSFFVTADAIISICIDLEKTIRSIDLSVGDKACVLLLYNAEITTEIN